MGISPTTSDSTNPIMDILRAIAAYLTENLRHFRAITTDDPIANCIYIRPIYNNADLLTLYLLDGEITWRHDMTTRFYDLTDPHSLDNIVTQLDKDLISHLGSRYW